MENRSEIHNSEVFESAKQRYFTRLALRLREAIALHQQTGQLDRDGGRRPWGNVTEHCLVEAARAEVLAQWLGFSSEMTNQLLLAAVLHDATKKQETERVKRDGSDWAVFETAAGETDQLFETVGFSESVRRIASSVGVHPLAQNETIAQQSILSDEDLACLVLSYIDAYTQGSDWVMPVSDDGEGGMINDVDRRVRRNAQNPRYQVLDEQGRTYLGGEKTFDAQVRIGHLIENRLVEEIERRTGLRIDPITLPELIDGQIKQNIMR